MPVTVQEFTERAARQARGGRTEAESRIYLDRVALLIPNAAHKFSTEVARDPQRRGRMRTTWLDVALTGGQVAIATGLPNLLTVGLSYGSFFDGEDDEMRYPLIYKLLPQALFQYTDANFGYCALLDDHLITKKRVSGSLSEMSAITVISNYVFDFSGSYPLPEEYEEDAITTLAELAATNAPTD